MNIAAYGQVFNLVLDKQILSITKAAEVLENAFIKVGIKAAHLGVAFDGKHLVPSADFMGQSYKKCEFTAAVQSQGVAIKRIAQSRK